MMDKVVYIHKSYGQIYGAQLRTCATEFTTQRCTSARRRHFVVVPSYLCCFATVCVVNKDYYYVVHVLPIIVTVIRASIS